MKTVTEAIESRKSIRSFLSNPVSNDLISDLLKKASFSPSGGNLQPWKIFIINDESMKSFLEFQKSWNEPEVPEYLIYPQKLKEPYRTSRYEMGELMYSSLGIDREDKASRANQMMKNFDFFNAPAGLFCFISGFPIKQTTLLIAPKTLVRSLQRQNFHRKTEASFHP